MANESEPPQRRRQWGPLMRVLRDFGGDADEAPAIKACDEIAVLLERVGEESVMLTRATASGAVAGARSGACAGGLRQTQIQAHQPVQVRTWDGRDVALPVDLLFPASGRLEEHVGYQHWSVCDAHLQLFALPDTSVGCWS